MAHGPLVLYLFSSPEPKTHGQAYSIGRPLSLSSVVVVHTL